MPVATCMNDLYDRLKDVGFDAKFVRDRILPDWWEDPLADEPANRTMAEIAISRMLGFPLAALHNPTVALVLPSVGSVRLKRNKGVDVRELMPSIHLAERTAQAVLRELAPLPAFVGGRKALDVRQLILARHGCVDLKALVDFAWNSGIAVLHLAELPKGRKFSGMALFCGLTPVVVLCHGSDSPPWLAFHLAHELGHIFLAHVAEGSEPLADSNIDQLDQDDDEKAADAFACTLLTGHPGIKANAVFGMRAPALVARARQFATQMNADPGTVVLIYGRKANRMPIAQNALKLLGCACGARHLISTALQQRLRRADDLPESAERFLSLLSAV